MGMDQNVAAGLSYIAVWVTGLIFFLMESGIALCVSMLCNRSFYLLPISYFDLR